MSTSNRVIQEQLKKLLDILGEDGVLVKGRVSYIGEIRQNFWKKVAQQLNSVDGGGCKNPWKWAKTWADWKNNTKRKANILYKKKNFERYTNQSKAELSKLELRLLKLIGYPLEERSDNIELSDEEDSDKESTDNHREYRNTLPQKSEKFSSDEETAALSSVPENTIYVCNSDGVFEEGKIIAYGDQSDGEEDLLHLTLKDPITKKRKMSLDEYKTKIQYAIQKERSRHKSEELRLRALELKLKGEELKIKQAEMNKINYLTNIEEEKLKYFKDISSSLKELVERSRNGSNRFHVI